MASAAFTPPPHFAFRPPPVSPCPTHPSRDDTTLAVRRAVRPAPPLHRLRQPAHFAAAHASPSLLPPPSRMGPPVRCMDAPVETVALLACGLATLSALPRLIQWYLTKTFVGPRPRGGTRRAEAARGEELAYLQPRETPWSVEELRLYDGTQDEAGPILLALDGLVFNVGKARSFYGPSGEYRMMAGRDASRLFAKTMTEEETEEEAGKPLSLAERATLAAWVFSFKRKYDVVGTLARPSEPTDGQLPDDSEVSNHARRSHNTMS
ncbi:hypothetical protein AB1Y20_003015 [Prymnesium parvum]|uniref:Cytochrome b5 heme-binding domain-containing protein n=1 Tax=Prymnesium parvum TaxID=97485 RepID=A0AB34JA83_PRYPA